jgi:hypothetical protein
MRHKSPQAGTAVEVAVAAVMVGVGDAPVPPDGGMRVGDAARATLTVIVDPRMNSNARKMGCQRLAAGFNGIRALLFLIVIHPTA